MRSTDTSDIQSSSRTYIKAADWKDGETKSYYYTGHEKVEKIGKTSGKPYVSYYIYLRQITKDCPVCSEETLDILAGKAQAIKGVKEYQQIDITKTTDENGYAEFAIVAKDNILPVKDRPEPEDYPEVSAAQAPAKKIDPNAEVNIDDIPF